VKRTAMAIGLALGGDEAKKLLAELDKED